MSVAEEAASPAPLPVAKPRRRAWILHALALTTALAALAVHAWLHREFIEDDAFISLRYSARLLQGKGLTWTDGERVEGYTNLLWVLGSAGLGALGIDLVRAVRILGALGMGATVLATGAARPPENGSGPLPALMGGLALAASGSIAAWVVGGLEQPMLAALLAWALVLLYRPLEAETDALAPRSLLLPGLLLGLACLTRADGLILAGAVAVGLVLARGLRRSSLVAAAGLGVIPALCFLGQLAFRRAYYGEWVPNTAHVKVAWSLGRVARGLEFLGEGLLWSSPLALVAVAAIAMAIRGGDPVLARRVRLLSAPLVAWMAHVVIIGGGDTMPARRHMVPILVLFALLTVEATAFLAARARRVRSAGMATVLLLVAAHAFLQRKDERNLIASRLPWAWDGEPLGLLLRSAFGTKRPLVAVDAAGGVPYFSGLPSLDMLGLNDRHIAKQHGSDFGTGKIGHEAGDGAYVLSRKPGVVIFCTPRSDGDPCWKGGLEMMRSPAFRAQYRRITVEALTPRRMRSRVWVRASDGPLAVVRKDNRIVVPGYFAAGGEHNLARFERGALVALANATHPGQIRGLWLQPGQYKLTAETFGADPIVEVASRREGKKLAQGGNTLEFAVGPSPDELDIHFSTTDDRSTRVVRVEIEPVPSPSGP
ncbi:hypothetical protein [Polyangium aurulentum]|uniref:hypothetical protein n=1 Tax=Polyangium aurulentum TaxID=2567896 RepID=UPI0010AE8B18|nr:hypothetical protein [Polyangium aurulentum]UQA58331.1 hypothetical protein E8A73_044985 [Polyangium aurulentum]